jgi:hypothetical protein
MSLNFTKSYYFRIPKFQRHGKTGYLAEFGIFVMQNLPEAEQFPAGSLNRIFSRVR